MLYMRILFTLVRQFRAWIVYLELRLRAGAIARKAVRMVPKARIQIYPYTLRPGTAHRGENWMMGDYTMRGQTIRAHNKHVFDLPITDHDWQSELHSFDWVRHVLARGTPDAAAYVKQCLEHWLRRPYQKMWLPMRPAIIARRLLSWSLILGVMRDWFDDAALNTMTTSIIKHTLWLKRLAPLTPNPGERLLATLGLCWGALWCQEQKMLHHALNLLIHELDNQILSDGGHISRNPGILPALTANLLTLAEGLKKYDKIAFATPIETLTKTHRRTQNMLRFMVYDHGRLANFNGCVGGFEDEILALIDIETPPRFHFAAKSGYQRLAHNRALVMVDCGVPPPTEFSDMAHLAPFAFEFSHSEPLIVNCGANLINGSDWHLATRSMAAHSMLGISNIDDPYRHQNLSARILGAEIQPRRTKIQARRLENDDAIWLECDHDLFRHSHRVIHHRRFYLATTGHDFRGEDLLLPLPQKLSAPRELKGIFTLRFHLHPDVNASLDGRGGSILLRTARGAIWRFQTQMSTGAKLKIERSIYLSDANTVRNSQQIVIDGLYQQQQVRLLWRFSALNELHADA